MGGLCPGLEDPLGDYIVSLKDYIGGVSLIYIGVNIYLSGNGKENENYWVQGSSLKTSPHPSDKYPRFGIPLRGYLGISRGTQDPHSIVRWNLIRN